MDIIWFMLVTVSGWYLAIKYNDDSYLISPMEIFLSVALLSISFGFLIHWAWQFVYDVFIDVASTSNGFFRDWDLKFVFCVLGIVWVVVPFHLGEYINKVKGLLGE